MSKSQVEQYWEKLDGYGEEKVRAMLANNSFNERHKDWVEQWLRNIERKHQITNEERHEMRADESLDLAREANKLAKDANKDSRNSNWIALGALIVAILALYFSLK